jgi:hypothetical protein
MKNIDIKKIEMSQFQKIEFSTREKHFSLLEQTKFHRKTNHRQ